MTKERLRKRLQALERRSRPPGSNPVYHATTMQEFHHLHDHPEDCPGHVRLLLTPVIEDSWEWERMARDHYDSKRRLEALEQ